MEAKTDNIGKHYPVQKTGIPTFLFYCVHYYEKKTMQTNIFSNPFSPSFTIPLPKALNHLP